MNETWTGVDCINPYDHCEGAMQRVFTPIPGIIKGQTEWKRSP